MTKYLQFLREQSKWNKKGEQGSEIINLDLITKIELLPKEVVNGIHTDARINVKTVDGVTHTFVIDSGIEAIDIIDKKELLELLRKTIKIN